MTCKSEISGKLPHYWDCEKVTFEIAEALDPHL